jgi:hypothetical protein
MKTIVTIIIVLAVGGCVYLVGFYRPRYESERPLSVAEASEHIRFPFPPSAHSIMVLKQHGGPGHVVNLVSFQADAQTMSRWIAAFTNAESEKWTLAPFDPAAYVPRKETPAWFDVKGLGDATEFRNDRTPVKTIWINSASNRVLFEEAD